MKTSGLLLAIAFVPAMLAAAEPAQLIDTIRAVQREGQGHESAIQALQELQQARPAQLPLILQGMQGANPLAINWLRNAFETVADRALTQNAPLPVDQLEQLTLDRKQSPQARRLAYEWLVKVDPSAEDRLIPGMIDDPSAEFRHDAVARLMSAGETLLDQKQNDKALAVYQKALSGAVDKDQVSKIAKALRKLGQDVNIQEHFGFIGNWHIIGPFDNKDMKGFDISNPPEEELDLAAEYKGVLGTVEWQPISTNDDYGIIDIAKQIAPHKGVTMYVTTEFHSPKSQQVYFRLGTPNAWKLYLNGKLIFAREEYHRGSRMDQYRVAANVKAGKNSILLKICQNEQEQSWAQKYQFQFRVCDQAGAGIVSATDK